MDAPINRPGNWHPEHALLMEFYPARKKGVRPCFRQTLGDASTALATHPEQPNEGFQAGQLPQRNMTSWKSM